MMFFQTVIAFLAVAASLVSAVPRATLVDNAPLAKRTTHTGTGTVYDQDGAYGSCGIKHKDNDMIVALTPYWQGHSYPPAFCGRKVQITNTGSNDGVGGKGRTIIATVADTCPGFHPDNSIDMSHGAWNQLINWAAYGTVSISWHFCNVNGQC